MSPALAGGFVTTAPPGKSLSFFFFLTLTQTVNMCNLRLAIVELTNKKFLGLGFPGGAVVKNPPASAGDVGSSPGPGRSHMPRSK